MTDPTAAGIVQTLLDDYPGTVAVAAWGETALFYNPGKRLARGVYLATVKSKDGVNDSASHLNRAGVFRVNLGTSRPLYLQRFGVPPPRPGKGGVVEGPWDFAALNRIMPHPVYGWMSWVAVLNPTLETLVDMQPMIDAAYKKAVRAFDARAAKLRKQ